MQTQAADLSAIVQELADRAELVDLKSQYGRHADEMRHDHLEDVFAENIVVLVRNGTVRIEGLAALEAQGAQAFADFCRVQHMITNILVELNGDTAKVRSNLIATHVYADDPSTAWVVKGFYTDEAIRTPKGWRFSQTQLHRVWEQDTGRAPAGGR